MAHLLDGNEAFGKPGAEPTWSRSDKNGVGTAYHTASRVWFTLHGGRVTETYWPEIGTPQLRDWQLWVGDGNGRVEDERALKLKVERIDHCLGYKVSGHSERFCLSKEIITDTYLPCLLQRVRVEGEGKLRLYSLVAPHLNGGGRENNAYVAEAVGQRILVAERNGIWLAHGASVPFAHTGVGYAGACDGATDLRENGKLTWSFVRAEQGNIALSGELAADREITLVLAFGRSLNHAVTNLLGSLGRPWTDQRERYLSHWAGAKQHRLSLEHKSFDGGKLYEASVDLLLAHEDKAYPGAFVASLSIPWGGSNRNERPGAYHVVWVRDLFISATGLIAAGDLETPKRSLVYLAASQQPDGSFPQNFTLDGQAHWEKIQLDQVAFPIILAYRLAVWEALDTFDPYPMVRKAVTYLIDYGPATEQERWEEAAGYSPSTTAVVIASMIAAASLARRAGDEATALAAEGYADFLESHLEDWMVTRKSALLKGIDRHYVRITPATRGDAPPCDGPEGRMLMLTSQGPDRPSDYPAGDIVDAGFLELVRWGIRSPHDKVIVDSLAVVDALLKVETPHGPCWRRYNHDGYGQRPNGEEFDGWGQGGPWPLLIGERAAYEVAAGRDISGLIRTMEGLAGPTQCLPEQIWDGPDLPELGLVNGGPTGAACPLMWPHSQYVKMLRFSHEGRVLDIVPEVTERYQGERKGCRNIEMWAESYPIRKMRAGASLRIQARRSYRLRWRHGDGEPREAESLETDLGFWFVEMEPPAGTLRFALLWSETEASEEHLIEVA